MKISENKAITMRLYEFKLTSILIMLLFFSGCAYEDFKEDSEYSSVYFANQIVKRNFVEDEINTIKIGVVLGGKRENTRNEWVDFTIGDSSSLGSTPYELMPEKYYTVSNENEFIISVGTFTGEISMEIDPSFFNDPEAVNDHYALRFKLQETSADLILSSKDSLLLLIGFESRYFGNYYHNGQVIRIDTVDGSIIDTLIYHQEEPVTNNVNNWNLSTAGSKTLSAPGIANYAPSDVTGFLIRVDDGYMIKIKEDTSLISQGFDWKLLQAEGDNYYDPDKKVFFMNYAFTDIQTGYRCFATDTLTFRNRILDGVNQWDF